MNDNMNLPTDKEEVIRQIASRKDLPLSTRNWLYREADKLGMSYDDPNYPPDQFKPTD